MVSVFDILWSSILYQLLMRTWTQHFILVQNDITFIKVSGFLDREVYCLLMILTRGWCKFKVMPCFHLQADGQVDPAAEGRADRSWMEAEVFEELGEGVRERHPGPLLRHHHAGPNPGQIQTPSLDDGERRRDHMADRFMSVTSRDTTRCVCVWWNIRTFHSAFSLQSPWWLKER